jgi:hypothetical protein
MLSNCPAVSSPVAVVSASVLLFSVPLSGCRLLHKAPFPLNWHIRGICPRFASDPFMEEGLAQCGWCRPCMAGVTLVSSLCRSCRDPATFNKASVKGFVVFAGSGLRWLKPASLAGCRGDPWGVSGQMALPLAYPNSHPHDNRVPPAR